MTGGFWPPTPTPQILFRYASGDICLPWGLRWRVCFCDSRCLHLCRWLSVSFCSFYFVRGYARARSCACACVCAHAFVCICVPSVCACECVCVCERAYISLLVSIDGGRLCFFSVCVFVSVHSCLLGSRVAVVR